MRRSGAQVERDYERGKWCAETKLFFFKKKKKTRNNFMPVKRCYSCQPKMISVS
jgi:hypothetical protein